MPTKDLDYSVKHVHGLHDVFILEGETKGGGVKELRKLQIKKHIFSQNV